MTLIEVAFGLQPSDAQIETVKDSIEHLVSVLNSKGQAGEIPPILRFELIGSLIRQTKPAPLDDVDLLCIVGEAERIATQQHLISRTDANFKLEDFEDNNLNSIRLLNQFKSSLAKSYPRSELRRNQEVTNVYLSSYDLSYDLLPCFHVVNDGYYLIPCGGGVPRWKRTYPDAAKKRLNDLMPLTSDWLKWAIMVVKHWFGKRKLKTPSSFHLECICCRIVEAYEGELLTLASVVGVLLHNLNFEGLLYGAQDPSGTGVWIESGLEAQEVQRISEVGTEAAALLVQNQEQFCQTL